MCCVDYEVIATFMLKEKIERKLKRTGVNCKLSKCELHMVSLIYLGIMADTHGIRTDPDAVEAVLT